MTHILIESAWWLLFVYLTSPFWFNFSCMAFCIWAIEHWRFRL